MLHSPGMSLAPGVFMRSDILGFGEISRARIRSRGQIADCDENPMRRAGMRVAGVIVRISGSRVSPWIETGKRIDPGARTQPLWP